MGRPPRGSATHRPGRPAKVTRLKAPMDRASLISYHNLVCTSFCQFNGDEYLPAIGGAGSNFITAPDNGRVMALAVRRLSACMAGRMAAYGDGSRQSKAVTDGHVGATLL